MSELGRKLKAQKDVLSAFWQTCYPSYMNFDLNTLFKTSPELFPKNIAIIMDGNRRWARQKGLAEIEGHKLALEGTRNIIYRAGELGVKVVTLWIWSQENFKRTEDFKNSIFNLARDYIKTGRYFNEVTEQGGKLNLIGDLSKFPKDVADGMMKYINASNPNPKKIDVNIAMGYGGRDEIVQAVKKLVAKGVKPEEVTEEALNAEMQMKEDVDLMIRTGGRIRTSGFFIWQSPYTELYFTDTLCPDFTVEKFDEAVYDFTQRVRNFGR